MTQRRALLAAALTPLAQPALVQPALAQTALAQRAWPTGPLRFMVPFPPGGSVDLVARFLQAPLQQRLGVAVVVENRSGASGAIGVNVVAKAAPDGLTFLAISDVFAALPGLVPNLPYDTRRDLQPVMLVGTAPMILCAHKSRPWKDMASLVAAAKAAPERITCGTSGNGTLAHLAMELMQQNGGFRTTHVPYRGGAPLVQACIAGELDLCIASAAPLGRLMQDGTLVPLVQTGATRSTLLPNLPTVAEVGIPGVDATAFWCLLAPAGVPPPVLAEFHAALVQVLADAELRRKFLDQLGIEVVASDGTSFGRLLEREMEVWAKVIRDTGIKAD